MTLCDKKSRVRASIIGAALGDALGAPFEFRSHEDVAAAIGKPWIDGLYPFKGKAHPHGIWKDSAPAGTGTDDTRYNWLLLEMAIQLKRMPSAQELASHFLEIYQTPESVFPDHPEYARKQFELWEGVCRGCLGQKSELYPNVPPAVLRERSIGLNYPTLIGLITLTCSGLMFAGQPEKAYAAAYQSDFVDIGYARECVAILAAALSIAISGDYTPRDVLYQALAIDPLQLGGTIGGPFVRERLPSFLSSIPKSCSNEELAEHLSRRLSNYHPYDPFKTLAIAFSSVLLRAAEPLQAILVSVNHHEIDQNGQLARYQDIDCYGCVTGALAGAIAGPDAFPPGVLDQVVASNKDTYGFDLESTIEKFIEKFC